MKKEVIIIMGSKNETARNKYLGMENVNNKGYPMKIIGYNNSNDITVEFLEPYKYIVKSRVDRFKNGYIHNPYAPWICDFGIVGTKYPTHTVDGKLYLKEYLTWTNMIKRCYDEEHRYRNPSYYDCECCHEWQYYENFYEWMHSQENYDKLIDINDMALDKDILYKGNRLYAPDRCCLVTQNINNIMLKSNAIRGKCPIGVFYNKVNDKYIAQCGGKENGVYLGSYNTELEAFMVYKKYKEKTIKELAQKEFDLNHITKQCYEALMNYIVEITD